MAQKIKEIYWRCPECKTMFLHDPNTLTGYPEVCVVCKTDMLSSGPVKVNV